MTSAIIVVVIIYVAASAGPGLWAHQNSQNTDEDYSSLVGQYHGFTWD